MDTDQNNNQTDTQSPVQEPDVNEPAAAQNDPSSTQDDIAAEDTTADQAVQDNPEETKEESSEEEEEQTESAPETAEESAQVETTEEAHEQEAAEAVEPTKDDSQEAAVEEPDSSDPNARWYVVHTYAGHENKVLSTLKQKVESEHLENKIFDILVPTQDKIEIRGGKKEQVKEKIFPGYILVKMVLDDISWLAVRTTPGVTSFVGMGNKPTPVPEQEVKSIVKFMQQGAAPTFKDVYMVNDTVKIVDGPFSEFIGKVDSVDKEKGKVRVLVSIFGRETPVELDFLQIQKL